jgi:dethiobiotin synthetase
VSRLVVITGTGTGIGKTHVAAALVRAWSAHGRVAGLKPVESGGTADGELLGQMSTFHVQRLHPPYMLARPVSPHLAAREEGRTIDPAVVTAWVDGIRVQADGAVVELAGGFFSPLAPGLTNAELAAALRPDAIVLVAPDRLGVLHDVGAVTRAAPGAFAGIVLSAPAHPDASTGTNAAELGLVTDVPVLGALPRAPITELDARSILARLAIP